LVLQYRPQIFSSNKKKKNSFNLMYLLQVIYNTVRVMVLNATFTIPGVPNSFGG
jgi:hypothetical protein